MSALVEVEALRFDYPGHAALRGLSFKLQRGSVTALVGPNGAGKTTLLRCLAGLERPPAGRIQIDGLDLAEAPREVHTRIGYLPDHFGLYEDLSVRRCLQYAAWSRRVPVDETAQRIDEVLAAVDLREQLQARAGSLSRGQRQRVALAQALIHRPALLLLDEPASGLDPDARLRFADLMRKLAARGMTLLVSSHILAELDSYCTRMLVLREGLLVEDAAVQTQQAPLLRLRYADTATRDAALQWLRAQPEIAGAEPLGADALRLRLHSEEGRQPLLAAMFGVGRMPLEYSEDSERLQDRYVAAVGGTPPAVG